jgi:outer membrane protein OmpA-like peptidoglycan-associated protein
MPRFHFIVALLAAIIFAIATVGEADAQTTVHGITIPTVTHDRGAGPFLVCTTTGQQNNRYTGLETCLPIGNGEARPSFLPREVVEAVRIISKAVNFDHDSIVLGEDAVEAIGVVSEWMEEVPSARLVLSGHTDATGTDEYNEALSENRARTVAGFLSKHGVDSERIDVQWFGESELLVDTLKRERANRRVLITFSIE